MVCSNNFFRLLTKSVKTICSLIFSKCLVVLSKECAWEEGGIDIHDTQSTQISQKIDGHKTCVYNHDKNVPPPVITSAALWQLKHLGTWSTWCTLSLKSLLTKFNYIQGSQSKPTFKIFRHMPSSVSLQMSNTYILLYMHNIHLIDIYICKNR